MKLKMIYNIVFIFFLYVLINSVTVSSLPFIEKRGITEDNNLPYIKKEMYCLVGGYCSLAGLTVRNLTITGSITNITILNINITGTIYADNFSGGTFYGDDFVFHNGDSVNDTFVNIVGDTMTGNLTIDVGGVSEDVELRLATDVSQSAYIYYMESDTDILGFRAWYDGNGGGTYKIDAIDGAGDIIPKMEISRDDYDADFFVNEDLNDNNITNIQCLELNGQTICSLAEINVTAGNSSTDIWNVIDNGTFQYQLQNSSNITIIGNTIYFNGTIGSSSVSNCSTCNISDLVNVDTAGVGAGYILVYHPPSGFWRATSSGSLSGWIVNSSGDFLYNDSDTLYYNYTKLDDEYVTYADFDQQIWGTPNITTRSNVIAWNGFCNKTDCYSISDFLGSGFANPATEDLDMNNYNIVNISSFNKLKIWGDSSQINIMNPTSDGDLYFFINDSGVTKTAFNFDVSASSVYFPSDNIYFSGIISTKKINGYPSIWLNGATFADGMLGAYDDDGIRIAPYSIEGRGNNNVIITTGNNAGNDHDHDIASINPTVFIHSNTDPNSDNTQWLSITHNKSEGIIATGKGDITLNPASGNVELGGSISFGDNDKLYMGDADDVSVMFNGSDMVTTAEVGTPYFVWDDFVYFDTANNRVGIGTDKPEDELEVHGSVVAEGSNEGFHVTYNNQSRIWIRAGSTTGEFIQMYNTSRTELIRLRTDGDTFFNTEYQFGIGVVDPTYTFQVDGGDNLVRLGNALYVDGDTSRVGIGTNAPSNQFEIRKIITAEAAWIPAKIYMDMQTPTSNTAYTKIGLDIDVLMTDGRDIDSLIRGIDVNVNTVGSDTYSHSQAIYGMNMLVSSNPASNNIAYGIKVDMGNSLGDNYPAVFEGGNVGIGTSTPNEKLTVVGNVNITENVNIGGDLSFNNPHLYGYDNTTQNFHTLETAQVMNITHMDYHSHQINVIDHQNITFDRNGHYKISISPMFYQASGNDKWITFWIQKNGLGVEWSNSRYTMDNDEYTAPKITWEIDIDNYLTDNVRVMWLSDSTASQIISISGLTNPIRPSIPAVITDITWISNGD